MKPHGSGSPWLSHGKAERSTSLSHLIAAGDEDAIAGFRDAHAQQVRAYCAVTCEPKQLHNACDAAFIDFLGRTLTAARNDRPLEELLLKATRSAAAARFRAPVAPASPRPEQCAAVPELLAARANGELPDDHALVAHVRHCARCQASAALIAQADSAFRESLGWEEAVAPSPEPEPAAATPPQPPMPLAPPRPTPPPSLVRVGRSGMVRAAKRFGKQLGSRLGPPS